MTELQKIFNEIDQIDSEREAWKRMFDMQSRLVVNLELEKIKLEKENDELKKSLKLERDVNRHTVNLLKRTREESDKWKELYEQK